MTQLINPSDKELDAAFTEHVAKSVPCDYWTPFMHGSMINDQKICGHTNCHPRQLPIQYCKYVEAVLPHLDKCKDKGLWVKIYDQTNGISCGRRDWLVSISNRDELDDDFEGKGWQFWEGASPTLARAAVIALLNANGVRIIIEKGDWYAMEKPFPPLDPPEENLAATKPFVASKLFHRKKFKKRT